MESVLPFFFCLVFPVLWTVGVFTLGRWSATHTIVRKDQAAAQSPYYQNFQEG